MSEKQTTNKIKEHLRRDGQSRQVFGRAVVRIPWYSPNRVRNHVIMALIISATVMSKPLYDFYYGVKRGIKFERERSKFIKQLDKEDEEEEERQRSERQRH